MRVNSRVRPVVADIFFLMKRKQKLNFRSGRKAALFLCRKPMPIANNLVRNGYKITFSFS